jgi:hypothetical protein
VALLVVIWQPGSARAEQPDRSGFTVEAHLGISNVIDSPDTGGSVNAFGIAPIGVGLGGFITPDFALLARITGASMYAKVYDQEEQLGLNFLGIVGQYWPADQVMLSAGAGAATFAPNLLLTNMSKEQVEAFSRSGYGFSLRGGYSFGVWESHSLRVSAEVLPAVFDESFVVGSSVIVEYQYY